MDKNCVNCKHCLRTMEFSDPAYGHLEADCELDDEKFGHWAYYEKDCKNWEAKLLDGGSDAD